MQPNRLAMRSLALAMFAGAASMRLLDPLLPEIAESFGKSVGSTAATVSAYAISYSCLQLVYGPLGDKYGAYRLVIGAVLASAITALLCAAAPSLGWLVGGRLLSGGVAAAIGPLTMAWVGARTSEAERPVAIASVTGAGLLGVTFGQIFGGLLGAYAGWRASFCLISMFFVFAGSGMLLSVKRYPQLLLSESDQNADHEVASPRLFSLLQSGAVRLVLFAVLIEGIGMYMSFTYVAVVLRKQVGLDTGMASLLISLFALGGIVFVVMTNKLVLYLEEGTRAALGAMLTAASIAILPYTTSIILAGSALMTIGFGFFMLHNVLQVRATRMEPLARSASMSLFAAVFFFAEALGAATGGWMLDRVGVAVPYVISAVMLSALGIALLVKDRRRVSLSVCG